MNPLLDPRTAGRLAAEAHETAKSKGWWDKPKPQDEVAALIISELYEAFEEWRNNEPLSSIYFDGPWPTDQLLAHAAAGNKPLGIPIELADAAIRILDHAGSLRADFSLFVAAGTARVYQETFEGDTFPGQIFYLTSTICSLYGNGMAPALAAGRAYCAIVALAQVHGVDLAKAIEIKAAYNHTRPFRHGLKQA